MSSKQMAYAATSGRRVSFSFLAANHQVSGYLVGMDDYHWLVACLVPGEVQTTLIHKSSADLVTISNESTLDSEHDYIKVAVQEIGRGFFAFCNRTYFGKTTTAPVNDRN